VSHVHFSNPLTTILHPNVTTTAVSSDQETNHLPDHQKGNPCLSEADPAMVSKEGHLLWGEDC